MYNNQCQDLGNRDEIYNPNFANEKKTGHQKSQEGGGVKVNSGTSCE